MLWFRSPGARHAIAGAVALVAGVCGAVAGCDHDDDGAASDVPGVPGVPVVGDALVDVAFADLGGFVDVAGRLGRAGLVPSATKALSQSGLESAGLAAPVDVAVRGSGDVVIAARVVDATRFHTALSLALPTLAASAHLERRVGNVDAVVVDGADVALVGVDRGVIVGIVAPSDALAGAALVDALLSGRLPAARRAPTSGNVITGGTPLAGGDVNAVSGSLVVDGNALVVDVDVGVADDLAALADGLAAAAPAAACVAEEGAAVALRLPPTSAKALSALAGDVDVDAFTGRLVVALHPADDVALDPADRTTWAHVVVAATPRVGAAPGLLRTFSDAAPGAVTRTVAGRAVRELSPSGKPWRTVSAVVDDAGFALGIGAPVIVDRIAAASPASQGCPEARLLTVDGPRARALVKRAAPELALLPRLGVDVAALPLWLRLLEASDRLELDATPAASAPAAAGRGIHVRGRLTLAGG